MTTNIAICIVLANIACEIPTTTVELAKVAEDAAWDTYDRACAAHKGYMETYVVAVEATSARKRLASATATCASGC